MSWWRHAFAVDPTGPTEPTSAEREVVDRLLKEIVRRRMTTPALIFFESAPSMNYIASQTMVFLAPFARVLTTTGGYDRFTEFLERRGSVEYMILRLETLEMERGSKAISTSPGESEES